MAENSSNGNDERPGSQNEDDPILQGVDRVQSKEEIDSHLASEQQEATEDTHTRSNIHLGGRAAEGKGTPPLETETKTPPQEMKLGDIDSRHYPIPDGGPIEPSGEGFVPAVPPQPEEPVFQSSGRATAEVRIDEANAELPTIAPFTGAGNRQSNTITALNDEGPQILPETDVENLPPETGLVDLGATDEDTSRTFSDDDLLANATDPEGNPLTVSDVFINPDFGVIVDNGDGTYTFEPAPDFNGDDLPIDYIISDGTTEIPGSAVIDVTPVNDPPTSADDGAVIEEDTSYTFSSDDFLFEDIEGDAFDHITIVDLPVDGQLTFNGNVVAPGDEIPASDIGLLVFTPVADANGDNYATFNFTVNDGTDDSEQYTFSIDVTPVNDAPTSADESTVIDEDTSYTFSSDDFLFEDVDGDNLHHITIVDLPVEGQLTFNGNAVAPGDEILASDIGLLVFIPTADENGDDYATFNFTVNDGTVDSEQYTFSIDVTPINDVPTVDDNETTILEDSSHTFALSDFTENYADIEGDSAAFVTITSLPLDGVLTLDGAAVVLGDNNRIAVADLGDLLFTPADDESGDDYASFTFTVEDDGDVPATSAEHSFTIDVTPVNDEPTSQDNEKTILEDSTYSFSVADFAYDDVEGEAIDHITITELPTDGVLTLDGNFVGQGDDIDAADIANLLYTPDENASGENYGDFKFTVSDGSVDSAEHNFSIDVTADADTPDLCLLGPIGELSGLYDISDGGIVSLDISYSASPALFENSHGYYVADSDGNPIGGAIIQDDITNGGSFEVSFNTDDYPGGVTLGFFIIPDGNEQNIELTDGDAVTFSQVDGVWTPFVDGSPLSGAPSLAGFFDEEDSLPAFFSNPALNADGVDHLENNEELGNQNWEDLVFGGDLDYGDVNASITVTLQTCDDTTVQGLEGTLIGLPDILTELNDVDGSEILSVTISSIPEGVTISDDQGNEFTATDLDNNADVSGWNLDELQVFSPVGQDDFVVQVTSTATEQSNDDTASSTLNVTVDILHGPTTELVDLGATPEDTSISFTEAQLIENAADLDGDVLHAFNVTIDPAFGTITNNGGGNYTFNPAADFNGIDIPVSYEITDGLVTINGSAIIDVTPVNDVPTLDDNAATILEDNSHTFALSDFTENYADIEGDSAAFVTITSLPVDGVLTLDGAAVVLGDNNKVAVADLGDLVFTPADDESGDDYASFTFTVEDDGTSPATSGEHTFTVDVTAVADDPNLSILSEHVDGAGLYDISQGGVVTINVEYFNVNAGYENSHGYYIADINGNPIGGRVVKDNVKELGVEEISFDTADYPGGVTLGFFILPDGDTQNPFLESNDAVTFENVGGTWTPYVDGVALDGAQAAPVYFSDVTLNPDGVDHVDNTNTVGNQNWEDLWNGGDSDNTDVNAFVTVTMSDDEATVQGYEEAAIALPEITGILTDLDGSETLTMTMSNIPDGVELKDGNGNSFTASADDNSADVSGWDLNSLEVIAPVGTDDFVLNVEAKSTEESNGDTATTNGTITVDILHVPTTGPVDLGATPENTAFNFTAAMLLENAIDLDGDILSVANVAIDPVYGSITDNGGGNYSFDPAADYNGDDLPITYDILDGENTINGNAIIDVTPVNEAPVSANAAFSRFDDFSVGAPLIEDTSFAFSLDHFAFSDSDGDPFDHITIVEVPANGELQFEGETVIEGQDVPAESMSSLVFIPDENESGENYSSFKFTVSDGELDSTVHTFTIDVEGVVDDPKIELSLSDATANMVTEVENVTITPGNVLDTGNGFTATARSINDDGSLSEASADNVYVSNGNRYFAVQGENDGPDNQIGYSDENEQGEELIITLDEGVTSLTFGYKYLYSNEAEYQAGNGQSQAGKPGQGNSGGTTHDEQGHYVLYNEGSEVGGGTFYGTKNGKEAFVTVSADDGLAFDQIVFTADPELSNDGDGHSDYALTSVSFENSVQVIDSYSYSLDITAGLVDGDLSEILSDITVSGVPLDAVFYDGSENPVGTDNDDGSWSFTDGELEGLVMTVPQAQSTFNLIASVTATETSNDDAVTSSVAINVFSGDNDNNMIASSAADSYMFGFKGDDAFAIGANDSDYNVQGGNGESWVDTIELTGFKGLKHEVGWTLVLDGEATVQSTDDTAGEMLLSKDAEGTITFDDGGSVTFENIEKISW